MGSGYSVRGSLQRVGRLKYSRRGLRFFVCLKYLRRMGNLVCNLSDYKAHKEKKTNERTIYSKSTSKTRR